MPVRISYKVPPFVLNDYHSILEFNSTSCAQCKINERIGIQGVSEEKMEYTNVLI